MINIRSAETREFEILTDLAVRSEAYWGYDSEFMDRFEKLYGVTEEIISKHPTYVLEENKRIIGFYTIKKDFQEASLEYFYIEPNCIGQGYGKVLWNHLTDQCKKMNISQLELVTSPQAKTFYIKMGAVQIDEVSSIVIKNRRIPKLIYTVNH